MCHQLSFKLTLVVFASLILSIGCAPADKDAQAKNIVKGTKKPVRFALQGSLLMPAEGAQFVNQGGAMGDLQLVYRCPRTITNTDYGNRTVSIDVVLTPRREEGCEPGPYEVVLARGLRARASELGERIQTNFVPPISTCGDYRLVVTENQIFSNAVVQLSSASPAVSVACSPLEDY